MQGEKGFVLVWTIFVIALASVMVTGYLLMATTELQVAHHQIMSQKALYVADAGFQSAIAQLEQDPSWSVGFGQTEFMAGSYYTVSVENAYPTVTLNVTATVASSYVAHITACVVVSGAPLSAPYLVRTDTWTSW